MAFNTVGCLLPFVSPFQLRLNSDNSERPFLHEDLSVLTCLLNCPPATQIFTEGKLIQSKMKKEGRNTVYVKVTLSGLLPGLEVIT
jgi:hypothetical protein